MQVYSYISAIDLIWESVQQLHRVIFNVREIPFKNDSRVFNDNKLKINDNDYFKHLRAIFGAHPINIKDPLKKDKGTQYFVNWPSEDCFGDYDFVSTLWSADVGAGDLRIGFKFSQLDEFLNIGIKNKVEKFILFLYIDNNWEFCGFIM